MLKLLDRLSIRSRLVVMAAGGVSLLLVVGGLGIAGMRSAEVLIEELTADALPHTQVLGETWARINDVRAQLLAALQHAPNSPLASLHDHPLSRHLERVREDLRAVDEDLGRLSSTVGSGSEDAEEARLTAELASAWKRVAEQVQAQIQALEAGRFDDAGRDLIKGANADIDRAVKAIDALFKFQADAAQRDYQAFESGYRTVLTASTSLLIVGALAALLFAWMTFHGVGRATRAVESASARLVEGDLTARVDYQSADELGQIAERFNRLGNRFHAVLLDFGGAVNQLASAAEETATVTAHASGVIQEQKSETDQVATAANEMSATVHEVAKNAAEAAEATRQADLSVDRGKEVVKRAVDTIGRLAEDVEQATQVIQALQKESEGIGTVLDVIKGVAEQTNLLALNAAIEAARAGESGRGFAVVADEVRTLASRTQQSTSEIQAMINRLQSGASNAVKVMEAGCTQARSGVEQAAEAGKSFEAIAASIGRVTDMTAQIASAAEEQSAVAEEINQNVVRISQGTDKAATGAEQTAAASQELARLAEHLQGTVKQFRV
jgi:methyl-accepting chemotaxis protein